MTSSKTVDWEQAAIGWRIAKVGDEQDAANWAYEHLDDLLVAGDELSAENERTKRELFKMPVTYGGANALPEMAERAADELARRTLALNEARAENQRLRNEQAAWEHTNQWQATEIDRLRTSDEAWKVQLERESARNERLQADQRLLDESVRNQAIRETIHKEELKRLRVALGEIVVGAETDMALHKVGFLARRALAPNPAL
jgi:hypothetical protein